ncbi:MAG: peroxide stress protein YaaA [Bacteroidota bacterium]
MIFIISPAKTLDYEPIERDLTSEPRLMEHTERLVTNLKKKNTKKLMDLMSVSESIASLNVSRYQHFSTPFTDENSKQALLAFKGDVYLGLEAENLDQAELAYAQAHLRILSGLYGLLRPMDRMYPYRLEMGTKLKTRRGKNLYEFWGDRITKLLNDDLASAGTDLLVNLASNEYFKAINKKKLNARILDIHFKEEKEDGYKMISFFAKKARGMMCNFAIKHQLSDPEHLKGFDYEGYAFNADLSTADSWTFTR